MRQATKDERPRGPVAPTPKTFIDLTGASGAVYRFERIDDLDRLPAIAGNFVYVRGTGKAVIVIGAGANETLLRAAAGLPEARLRHAAESLYIRRNISWRTRSAEHTDIVGRHQPVMIMAAELERGVVAATVEGRA